MEESLKGQDSYWKKAIERMERKDKAKHNPIITLTDVVLDTIDGDFSLTINGKDHLWIDNDSIIDIANYIEKL
jgi:hypothetical protein